MNREQLQQAITETLDKIQQIKDEIEKATDPWEEKKLLTRLKELQYRQLWHIDQIKRLSSDY